MNTKIHKLTLSGMALAVTAACSSLPDDLPELQAARASVSELAAAPKGPTLAGDELNAAENALEDAEMAFEEKEDREIIEHHAYRAERKAQIGLERVADSNAQAAIDESETLRTQLQLQSREREARRAELAAERAQREAARSEANADQARAEARRLADELDELKAEETARGLVLTMDSVLFATDSAMLAPGATMAMDRLAAFMNDYPDRRLRIEGHTDARGPDAYNVTLSEQRASAVQSALMSRGIAADRLVAIPLGETYPVASNETAAGRQQNRRVEIVVSNRSGSFPTESRTAALAR